MADSRTEELSWPAALPPAQESPTSLQPIQLPPPASFPNLSAVSHSFQAVEWPSRQILSRQQQEAHLSSSSPAAASRPAPLLSSSLLRLPDRSYALPYDISPRQLYGGTSFSSSHFSKSLAGSKDQRLPLSQQIMMDGGSLILEGANGEFGTLPKMTPQEILDAKALAASKSHSEAERRRRERINTHLATLRNLLPSSTKTDKASLLAEVIDYVKELKRQAAEIAEGGPVPTDVDELTVDLDLSYGEDRLVIRASICCDDRPDLLSDLIRTLRTLGLKTVRAEIATLGGRVKNVFLMTRREDYKEAKEDSPSVNCVQEALKAVLEKSVPNDLSPGSLSGNKRQRLSHFDASSPQDLDQRSF